MHTIFSYLDHEEYVFDLDYGEVQGRITPINNEVACMHFKYARKHSELVLVNLSTQTNVPFLNGKAYIVWTARYELKRSDGTPIMRLEGQRQHVINAVDIKCTDG